MKIKIDSKIFETFKGLNIGVLVGKKIDNSGSIIEEVQAELRKEEGRIRNSFESETLSQNPKINVWRKAYSQFGGKPKENRSSIESLYRLVLRNVGLRHINNLVDIYNYISLKYMFPVGGEDLDEIKGDILLTFASGNEAPINLLGDREAKAPHLGEVIYKDDESTICRRWNWREAERTKLTEKTKNAIFVIEGLTPVSQSEIKEALEELSTLINKYCKGNISTAILDKKMPEFSF